jgi:hypothetical protein
MPPRTEGFDRNVFINCPFDAEYLPLAHALVFTVLACGLRPRLATERSDSGEVRVEKIRGLIQSSRLSIHDLSRMEPLHPDDLPRFNMPFELGLDLGCRHWGSAHLKSKQCLILDKERYRFQRVLSDISGSDIRAHANEPEQLVQQVRSWLRVVTREGLPPAGRVWEKLSAFRTHLEITLGREGFSAREAEALEMTEYIDFVRTWMPTVEDSSR